MVNRFSATCALGLLFAFGLVAFAEEPDSRLADAAMTGQVEKVRELLQQKVDVNAPQGDGSTALHWAAYREDVELVRALLKAGAAVGPQTRLGAVTPIFMAAKTGNAAILDLLLKAGADGKSANGNGTTPLMLAAASGNVEAVRLLLDRGADVNAKDKTNGQNAVMFAAALGRADVASLLASRGANLNATTNVTEIIRAEKKYKGNEKLSFTAEGYNPPSMGGMTALQFAAREGHMETVRRLVDAGADVNQVNASDHMSIITSAILNGRLDIAMYLLDKGANPNLASKEGVTPLYATIDAQWAERTWYPAPSLVQEKTNYLDLVKGLLAKGADPNARLGKKLWFRTFHGDWIDPAGATAFWLAAKANDIPAMRILVAAGADPGIPSTKGATPLQAAAGFGLEPQVTNFAPNQRLAAVKYLVEEIGADVNARDNQGYTPLHGAALTANHEVIKYLVAAGGDVKARATFVFGGEGESDKEVVGQVGDTVADMANGPKAHNLQYPETVELLVTMGSENSDYCRAATCLVRTAKETKEKK